MDKAGALLRKWWEHGDPDVPLDEAEQDAVGTVWKYRRRFTYPTTKVASGLRYYTSNAGADFVVGQRWKRLPRIIEKLARYPTTRLSQMQDVGGCRAVLPNQQAVDEVLVGIRKNWDIITVDDYVETPRASGYRAIHPIVRKDDLPIEVQLRTVGQQDWADEVERIDGSLPDAIKDGEGPAEIFEYLHLLSDVIAAQEAGEPADRAAVLELGKLGKYVP